MTQVTIYQDQFNPHARTVHQTPDGLTAWELTRMFTGSDEWPECTICLVNGTPTLRKHWDQPLSAGDVVEFRMVVMGGKNAGYIVGGLMVAAGIALTVFTAGTLAWAGAGLILGGLGQIYGASQMVDTPGIPSYFSDQGSPTYSVSSASNRKRVGEPIPVVYGRHRLMPDLIASPYVYYVNDEQYVASILCLGNGEFAVDTSTLRYGEALVSELEAVSYQVVPPGEALTLCRDHVSTSQAINGQTLVGPSADVQVYGATRLTFATSFDGISTYTLTITASTGIFSVVVPTDQVIVTGTTGNNGTWTVATASSTVVTITSGSSIGANESPIAALITRRRVATSDLVLITLPTAVTYTAATKTITAPAGTFTGALPGWGVTSANTVSNNRTFTVVSVAGDGSSVVVYESVTNETATNPQLGIHDQGFGGWFEVAGPNDTLLQIEVDLIAPRGIGTIANDGSISGRTITAEILYQALDSTGAPVGPWLVQQFSITAAQQKVVRRTPTRWVNDLGYPRARIRFRRTTTESGNSQDLDTLTLAGLKGYLADVRIYPGVTTLAVVGKATEQLSGQQAGQVNVVAQRKIPIWDGTTWSAPTATSAIAWAIADLLRDQTYGAGLADDEIDLDALLALDALWTARGDEFNAVYDQTLTVWEGVQRIARAGRAVPLLAGGVVTLVRDGARTLRTAMFTPATILPGSLSIEYRLPQDQDPDGTSVAWIDPATWQPAHVELRASGGSPINPAAVDLFGVTNLAQATREATYLDRTRIYQRKTIRWRTEMDGHLVSVGDLVALAHDVPAWGQSAELLGQAGTTYTTTDPLTWTAGATHYALFRRPDGTVAGPFPVTAGGTAYEFICATALDFVPRLDLSQGDRTTIMFGPGTAYTQDVVITAVAPQDQTTVELTAVPYDARIHAAGA